MTQIIEQSRSVAQTDFIEYHTYKINKSTNQQINDESALKSLFLAEIAKAQRFFNVYIFPACRQAGIAKQIHILVLFHNI